MSKGREIIARHLRYRANRVINFTRNKIISAATRRKAYVCNIWCERQREKEGRCEREREKGEGDSLTGCRFIAKIQVYLHPSRPAIKNRKLSSGYWSISKQRTGCWARRRYRRRQQQHHRPSATDIPFPFRERREDAKERVRSQGSKHGREKSMARDEEKYIMCTCVGVWERERRKERKKVRGRREGEGKKK